MDKHLHGRYFRQLFLLLSFCFTVNAQESEYRPYGPIMARCQNPLYLLFLTDTMDRGATSLSKGEFGISLESTLANIIKSDLPRHGIGEDIDFEQWRTVLKGSYGVINNLNVGVEIPFSTMSRGFGDGSIRRFHKAFGFPQVDRDQVPDYRLSYLLTRDSKPFYHPVPTLFGLSDIVLWGKFQMVQETESVPAFSIKSSIKIPSGSPKNGTGSGNPDLAVSLFMEKTFWRFHSYTLAGFSLLGGMDILNPILRSAQFTFGQAFEFTIIEGFAVVAQFSGNTSIFKNVDIAQLKGIVGDLNIGFVGDILFHEGLKRLHYEFSLTEDPISNSASEDVAFMFKVGFVL